MCGVGSLDDFMDATETHDLLHWTKNLRECEMHKRGNVAARMKRLNEIEKAGGGMRTQMIHVFVMCAIKCGCAGVCLC